MNPPALTSTPWDAAAFGLATWELPDASAGALALAARTPGHHTVRVDPLASKRLLHEHGFYYCDTLLEPWCKAERLRDVTAPADISIGREMEWQALLDICHGAFPYGRFHRDFNLDPARADLRYNNWLRQLYEQNSVYGLFRQGELSGFIACSGGRLVLHAVADFCRGKGYAKYWWAAVCRDLFAAGNVEVSSSISVANLAALNLYASLGFAFRNEVDIYHRLVT